MNKFDDDDLFGGPQRDHVHQTLPDLSPSPVAAPCWTCTESSLAVTYETNSRRRGVVLFKHLLAFRSSPSSVSKLARHHLFERGLTELGVYVIGDSSTVREAGRSWIGHSLSASDAWNMRHYVVVFGGSLLECVAGSVEYDLVSSTTSANEVFLRHLSAGSLPDM